MIEGAADLGAVSLILLVDLQETAIAIVNSGGLDVHVSEIGPARIRIKLISNIRYRFILTKSGNSK